MTQDQLEVVVLCALAAVAPEANLEDLRRDVSFRDQFELDSVDFLHLALALEEELGVKIPAADHLLLSTLQGCVAYLGRALKAAGPP
jgi:acyl carrier protein